MRIGVFGGSFDPVHIGHLIVAEHAADALTLDRVHFIPTRAQPLKPGGHAAPLDDRVKMLRLATGGNPRFLLDLREARREGPSYTVDTLQELRSEFPDDWLCLLIGSDAAREFAGWRDGPRIAALAEVIALSRSGTTGASQTGVARTLQVPRIDVSATQVRDTVRRGGSIRYLVPPGVADYIDAHSLYRT